MFDRALLEILVCPLTKTKLTYNDEKQELESPVGGIAYPIREGIPILLVEEARIINEDQVRLLAPELLLR